MVEIENFNSLKTTLSGYEIFNKPQLSSYLKIIRNLVSCPNRVYKKLYQQTLYNLAEYCQDMSYCPTLFDYEYGFLTRQLQFAIASLKLRREKLLPKNVATESIAAEEAQWTYAVFTASLLNTLYLLQNNREVIRYQIHGIPLGKWNPLSGSLYQDSFSYQMKFASEKSNSNNNIFMAAISSHLIPEEAVAWLGNNESLFNDWWEVILDQPVRPTNEINIILSDAQLKLRLTG